MICLPTMPVNMPAACDTFPCTCPTPLQPLCVRRSLWYLPLPSQPLTKLTLGKQEVGLE